jgi:hypothetical protein
MDGKFIDHTVTIPSRYILLISADDDNNNITRILMVLREIMVM